MGKEDVGKDVGDCGNHSRIFLPAVYLCRARLALCLLPRLVGRAKALELVLTARVILAPEAAEIGLVNRVVPAEELLEEARSMAQQMAESDPAVIAAAKRAIHFGESASMADAMKNEQRASAELRKNRGKGS